MLELGTDIRKKEGINKHQESLVSILFPVFLYLLANTVEYKVYSRYSQTSCNTNSSNEHIKEVIVIGELVLSLDFQNDKECFDPEVHCKDNIDPHRHKLIAVGEEQTLEGLCDV